MRTNEILTGIITFNPDIVRLKENIEAAILQVGNIVIIDNGSNNKDEIVNATTEYPNVEMILYYDNLGIAKALADLMNIAKRKGFKWVFTLDQDSVMLPGLISEYCKIVSDDIGALTCQLIDRNYSVISSSGPIAEINECFTSGFLLNCEKYFETSGYDEKLFIDYVDYDLCYKLRENGNKIIRIDYPGILHEYGRAEEKQFFCKKVIVTNHPAWRKYYMVRNIMLISKRHRNYVRYEEVMRTILSLTVKSIIYENMKIDSLKSIVKGIFDGIIKSDCYEK